MPSPLFNTGHCLMLIITTLSFFLNIGADASGSIVVCISPLTALMMDQSTKYNSCGLKAEFIGSTQTNALSKSKVLKGEVQLVFATPEVIIQNTTYRNMLLSPHYKERLVCVAVDEAHCVKVWGEQFRPTFSQIGDLRSIIPSGVNILALTATATAETFHTVSHQLSMVKPVLVGLPPHRQNIVFNINPKIHLEDFTASLCEEFKAKQATFPKTVIYVRTYTDCSNIYMLLKQTLGKFFTDPPGYPNHRDYRLIDMFTAVLTREKKEEVLELFTRANGQLRLVIATTAFGMGVDCPDIRRVIHWGIPTTLEEYVQETGRSGRDGEASVAILYQGVGGRNATAKVKAYLVNTITCRRRLLFQEFLLYSESSIEVSGCQCCDLCLLICTCSSCSCI